MLMAYFIVCSLLLMVLAPPGAYTLSILGVQYFKNTDFEHARLYMHECMKDLLYKRSKFFLERTHFPQYLKNDIAAYLSETDYERWVKRFNLISKKSEESGMSSNNLPFYSFVLLVNSEENKAVYENIIRELCKNMFQLGHLTELRSYIEWSDTDDQYFKICIIVYARTASEQETFNKLITYMDSRNMGIVSNEIADPELERDLFGEEKKNEKNGR